MVSTAIVVSRAASLTDYAVEIMLLVQPQFRNAGCEGDISLRLATRYLKSICTGIGETLAKITAAIGVWARLILLLLRTFMKIKEQFDFSLPGHNRLHAPLQIVPIILRFRTSLPPLSLVPCFKGKPENSGGGL